MVVFSGFRLPLPILGASPLTRVVRLATPKEAEGMNGRFQKNLEKEGPAATVKNFRLPPEDKSNKKEQKTTTRNKKKWNKQQKQST